MLVLLHGLASKEATAALGRTIAQNAAADPQAQGYVRVPHVGACDWRLMLAARGNKMA